MKRMFPFFVLITIILVNLSLIPMVIAHESQSAAEKKSIFSDRKKSLQLLDKSPLSAGLQKEKRFSAYGDFLVSVVDIIDPATGQIIGSRIERLVVINGVVYKALVSGRREQMTTKLNIPMQGAIINDTVLLDDNPARIVSTAEYNALSVDQSKLTNTPVVAEIGGQVAYFSSTSEFDKFIINQIVWESKIGPTRSGEGPSAGPASSYTEGPKNVLFMRLDFPDREGEPVDQRGIALSSGAAQTLMDNAVNPFYVNNSYNKTSLTTTVTPVLRMPKPLSEYVQSVNSSAGAGLNLILTDARNAAQAAGFNVSSYERDIIATSYNSALGFAGLGWIGAKGNWLNGYFDLRVASHEMGHNYGLRHANLYRSTTNNPIGAGNDIEYGDCYDSMGNSFGCFDYQNPRVHFNARYKRILDWLTDANIQTVTSNGIYRVTAHDSSTGGGIRLLRVGNYWIELRQLFSGNAANGILIRRDYGSSQTELLDMTPTTTTTGDEVLLPGQIFHDGGAGIRITTINKIGTTPESIDVKIEFNVFTNPPTAPASISANAISASQINVTWNPVASATGYNLRINGSTIINGVTSPYQARNLLQNTTYSFEVQAVNEYGASPWSTPASAKTLSSVPTAPKTITGTAISTTQINVFWDQNPTNENVISYNLRINGSQVITGITYLSYAITNLAPDTPYTFEVQAVNAIGASGWSVPANIKTPASNLPPAAPTNISPQVVSSSQINLFWNASTSPNIASYNLRINGAQVITGITYLSYAVRNLTAGSTYTFEVQAVDANGATSNWSAPVSATTTSLAAPTNVSPQVVSSSQINLFWNASTSPNIASYNLRINGAQVITGITYLSYAVRNLTAGSTYTFEVQAVDANGATSNWSAPVSATTTSLAAPTNVSPQVVSSSQINLFWNASTSPNIASYNLRINGAQVITGITYLSYAVRNLTAGSTYTFEVQAVDANGATSNWSAPVSATTSAAIASTENGLTFGNGNGNYSQALINWQDGYAINTQSTLNQKLFDWSWLKTPPIKRHMNLWESINTNM